MEPQFATARRTDPQPRPREAGGPPRWLGPLARVPLLLGAICGLAICLAGGLVLTVLHGGAQPSLPSPDDSAHAICADLLGQEYANLYGLLSTAQKTAGTDAEFEASQRQLDITAGKARQCTASVTTMASEQAQAHFTLARGEAAATNETSTLIYADGAWRLDTYDPAVI